MELDLEIRHKKEKKELQAQIQALKKVAKNDKSKKKELTSEIVRLETALEERHKSEMEHIKSNCEHENTVTTLSEDLHLVEINKTKISKAQKRRDKKSLHEKQLAAEIKAQEKENRNGPRSIELKTITNKLKENLLQMHLIPSDGDCLYKAVAHQAGLVRDVSVTVQELRNTVAHYIETHKEDFIHFMINPDTDDILTDTEFDEYCQKLRNTKEWGGQLELRALSNVLKCPIRVIQASGPEAIEQGSEFDGPALVITYHRHMYSLGEHYNSTEPLVEETEESN